MANRDSNTDFRSLTGQGETAEPANNNSNGSSPTVSRKGPSKPQSSQSSQSTTPTPTPTLRKSSSSNLAPQTASPLAASPHTSRNTSPIRKDKPPTITGNLSTQPSAAAIQRALSASSVPQLQQQSQQGGAVSEAVSKLPRVPKSASASGENTPSWPVSPRLKSPPPSGPTSRRGSATAAAQRRDQQPTTPSIEVISSTPQNNTNTSPVVSRQASRDNQRPDPQLQPPPPPKASSRGASGKSMLETVQENSSDVQEPSPAAAQAAADLKPLTKISDDESRSPRREPAKQEGEQKTTESGSESAGNKSDSNQSRGRRPSASQPASHGQQQRPKNTAPKSSYSLTTTKSRAGDGKQGMTVETETVQSIPQSGLAPAGEGANRLRTDNSGSIRLKASNETIRPKKERKKADRQKRSVNQGTGMSYTAHSPFHLRRLYQDRRYVSAYESLYHNALQQRKDDEAHQSPTAKSRLRRARSMYLGKEDGEKETSVSAPQRPTFPHVLKHAISTGILGTLSDRFVRKATSKADLFEARVANAVDEANTSDSDETFVYESNPPEPQRRGRHHSRTPSVTSSHSMAEQQRGAIRGFGDAFDERRVGGKRSMKFSSNPYNDVDSPESNSGTVRTHTPRHIGRFGRGGHHSANYEQDSPFTQASKLRQNHLQRSRPNSPKSPQSMQFRSAGFFTGNRKQEPYDFDAEQNADDERTPLMGTVRGPRGMRNTRRLHSSMQSMDDDDEDDSRWRCCSGRYSACCLTTLVIVLVIVSAIGFIFSANRPLYDVEIHEIKNVLASEQELFLDLKVGAINPNTLSISVADMDVNIFAKSKHVGSKKPKDGAEESGRRGQRRSSGSSDDRNPNPIQDPDGHWHAPGSDDKDSDLEKDAQTMLLGRIFHFDQALSFDASPIKQKKKYSMGQVRLTKPGNKTEIRGSERWEQVIQYPFELIVRGILRYQLPISARVQSAAVGASVMVHPEEGIDDRGNMRLEPIDHSEHWQWIDWPDIYDDDRIEGDKVEEIE
ncbi:hypothetical protein PRZ48_010379 [Zasmidium cellare]|uniref:Vacuolar segregation protein 7 n=1 Tax=Zasmidium cellare TaxID=395010 RepID=A0ABR0E925_ZASCE|nr:hypothetical protein PRZ48_010379 [Zasmidium cellare]